MSFSRLAQCSPFTMHALSVLFSVCFFCSCCFSVPVCHLESLLLVCRLQTFVLVVTLKVCSVYYYQFLSHLSMLFFFLLFFFFFFLSGLIFAWSIGDYRVFSKLSSA